ncbi:PQQ-binding-like beta-propeller repeat protein [Haloferax sp. DFSO60]|uniref:PQQ-binding-like beta-propeller repeat protein n=1 Tax=Haloferax sp. DFSO60 TaxID=3388652 RepID=UPI00397CBF12
MPSSRRSFLAACAAGISSLAGCLSLEAPSTEGSWSRRTLNNEHTGYSETNGPTTDLYTEWRREDVARDVSPVVADETVYVGNAKKGDDESTRVWVEALDAATGKSRWKTELYQSDEFAFFYLSDSMVVEDDRLFVQTKPGLTMLTTDGEVQWTFDNLYQGQQVPDVVTPVVTDEVVVAGTYESSVDDDQPETVFGIDPETGEEQWRATYPGFDGMWQLAGADGLVYVPFHEQGIVALDTTTGAEQWRWEGPTSGTPTITDELLLVTLRENNKNSIVALDRHTRSVRWRVPIETQWPDAELAVDDSRLYYMAGFSLEARRLDTGERVWQVGGRRDDEGQEPPDEPQFDLRSTPVVSGGSVYAPGLFQRETSYGQLFVFDAASGEKQGQFKIGRNETSDMTTPAVTEDLVYLTTDFDNLYALGECTVGARGYCLLD